MIIDMTGFTSTGQSFSYLLFYYLHPKTIKRLFHIIFDYIQVNIGHEIGRNQEVFFTCIGTWDDELPVHRPGQIIALILDYFSFDLLLVMFKNVLI